MYLDGIVRIFESGSQVGAINIQPYLRELTGNFRIVEFANGKLRARINVPEPNTVGNRQHLMELQLVRTNGYEMRVSSKSALGDWVGRRYIPTTDSRCDTYAYFDPQGLRVGKLGQMPSTVVSLRTQADLEEAGGGTPRMVTFSPDCSLVAVRENTETVDVYPVRSDRDDGKVTDVLRSVDIPDALKGVSEPNWVQLRPALAMADIDKGWRFAWPTPQGVAVLDAANYPDAAAQSRSRHLLTGLDNVARLSLSSDGTYLVALNQNFARRTIQTQVRIWKLIGDQRGSGDDFREEACRVAAIETGTNKFTDEERNLFSHERPSEPCSRNIN
jgi:hypothetical protein